MMAFKILMRDRNQQRLAVLKAAALVALAGPLGCSTLASQEVETEIVNPTDGSLMRLIPAGEFVMGSPERRNQRPPHPVYVDAFYMDAREVTNRQWKAFVTANPQWSKDRIDPDLHDGKYLSHWTGDDYPPSQADHPVVFVSWHAAAAYAAWAGKRLPTEAEWERAARGSQGYRFAYGEQYDERRANTGRTVEGATAVGSYEPNEYGLFDMTGNVLEWCADWFSDTYYASSPRKNPQGPAEGSSRLVRGGAWNYYDDRCTTTFRFPVIPPLAGRACANNIGFRCAKDIGRK